jgi:hypothetical protein
MSFATKLKLCVVCTTPTYTKIYTKFYTVSNETGQKGTSPNLQKTNAKTTHDWEWTHERESIHQAKNI